MFSFNVHESYQKSFLTLSSHHVVTRYSEPAFIMISLLKTIILTPAIGCSQFLLHEMEEVVLTLTLCDFIRRVIEYREKLCSTETSALTVYTYRSNKRSNSNTEQNQWLWLKLKKTTPPSWYINDNFSKHRNASNKCTQCEKKCYLWLNRYYRYPILPHLTLWSHGLE